MTKRIYWALWLEVQEGGYFKAQTMRSDDKSESLTMYLSVQEFVGALPRGGVTFNVYGWQDKWRRLCEGATYEEAVPLVYAYCLGQVMV